MLSVIQPALWLIVLIVGLPQLSETVYTPSLPEIAASLKTSATAVEHTLTIYLFGFALGTLFWGRLSDRLGRKPCVLIGLLIFIIGSVGCYRSGSIEGLMFSRFVQAFGGSVGSVLGQAICRDAFHGPALGKVYSSVGSALALFPAIGPFCGGLIIENWGWRMIFIFLIACAVILTVCSAWLLPETHPLAKRQPSSIWSLIKKLIQDQQVLAFAFIVAGCNGILFSYFAEGPFYLINGLGLTPSLYGLSFVGIALSTMAGGLFSRYLHNRHSSAHIMQNGLYIILVSAAIWSLFALTHYNLSELSALTLIAMTLMCQMACSFGICMATSNALALALVHYKSAIGAASSLFGFFYYSLIAVFTLFMGLLHDGTLLPMPLYFLALSCCMTIISDLWLSKHYSS